MPLFDAAARVASRQHGVITRSQLAAAGCSDRNIRTLVRDGVLEREERGLYVVAGSPPSWHQRVLVACLAGGPLALAGHRCAASLWQLDRYRAGVIELAAPYQSARMRAGLRVHRSTDLPARDRTVLDGIPVTSPARTLVDVSRYMTRARLGSMVDDAVRRGLTSYEELHERFNALARPGRDGIATMRAVLVDRPGGAPVPGSSFETEVRALLLAGGVPEPVLQHRVQCDDVTYVLDLAWPELLVAVECDGFRFHRTPDQLDWDARRQSELALRAWLVHHVTWPRMRRAPEEIVADVRRALSDRTRGRAP